VGERFGVGCNGEDSLVDARIDQGCSIRTINPTKQFLFRLLTACQLKCSSLHRIGSGVVSRLIAEQYGCLVVGVDVNDEALRSNKSFAKSPYIELIRGDLVSWARTRPGNIFDVVVFNPPYVPTDEHELRRARLETDIAASWAGGHRGREVIDRALRTVRTVLVDNGVFYLVVEESNEVPDVLRLGEQHGLVGKVLLQRSAGREVLYVLRFVAA
jgi:release factor glutamine methyltransferase